MRALRGVLAAILVAGLVAASGGGGSGGFIAGSSSSSSGGSSSSSGSSSSGGGSVSNTLPIQVNFGPQGNYVNGVFTTITLCVPGTSTCQTINNVLVDTGSYGLRILGSVLNLPLPPKTNSGGTIGECTVFADGYTWGPVANADLKVAGETASNLAVNIFGTAGNFPNFPSPPSSCSSGHGTEEDTLDAFGAYAILGVGPFPQDCGEACAQTTNNPGDYYACGSNQPTSCSVTTQSLADQVTNPVVLFAQDNNGVVVELPSISSGGQATANGSLIFGIGTQSNNQLGSAQILTVNDNAEFRTNFNGSNGIDAFIDSGSNALYFTDNNIPFCASPNNAFYCPSSTENLSAQMVGENNVTVTVPFAVANTDNLSNNNAAIDDLAGSTGTNLSGFFDWGVPFFYGRNVFFAIYGQTTPSGEGPYYAF